MTTTIADPITTGPISLLEYYNAANAVYGDNGEGVTADTAPPKSTGLTLLLDSGQINANWIVDGFFAQAFVDSAGNILVAFEGTNADASLYGIGSVAADAEILVGQTPQAFIDASAFTADVKQYLVQHNLGADPIYLTGHSLGGAEAEYVASLTTYSGVTFGAPGTLSPTYKAPVAGQNFIDYLDWGDLIGNFGHHFGTVKELGPVEDLLVALRHQERALEFHRLTHYATDLGLTPSSATDLASATDLGLTPSKSVTDAITNPNLGVQSESNSTSLLIQNMASFTTQGQTQGQLDSWTMTNHDDVNSPSFLAVSHV